MVVVEGVARSLDPHINIWQVARPIVEGYIRDNVGPRALVRDLGKTLKVMARFGPRLPAMVEARLIKTTDPLPEPASQTHPALWMAAGAAMMALGVWIGTLI
jgi:ubiquinone biosynthesis protein